MMTGGREGDPIGIPEITLDQTLTGHGKTAIVRGLDPAVAAALLERERCEPLASLGRGHVFRFPLADGAAILRPYRRGGLVSLLSSDSYLVVNRPRREWDVHVYLYEQGFPVPEPLGVVWERRGLLYRGAFATRWIYAVDILEFARAYPDEASPLLARVGELIRRMHDLGVYHADLQVRNILVRREDRDLAFIDFDNARRLQRVSGMARARNLLRLRRSCLKNGMAPDGFAAIQRGYGMQSFPWWLDRAYRVKGTLSDAAGGHERMHAG